MKGTVIRRGSRWSVVIDAGRDESGKRIREWHSGFPTKREAEAARIEILGQMQRGQYVAPTALSVVEFLRNQWLPAKRSTVRENTWRSYRSDLEAHVIPTLGSRLIQKLTPSDLNRLYAELEANGGRIGKGLAPKTVRNIHGIIHRALSDAVRWDLVSRNAADGADAPRARRVVMEVWTGSQLRLFLAATRDDPLYPLFVLAASTGMRRSELLGLRWRNIDFDERRLAVADTVVVVGSQPVLRLDEGKTDFSRRVVALDASTIDLLQGHRVRRLEERMRAGPVWQDLDLVFCRDDGSVIRPDWATRRFQHLARQIGLPPIGLHGLRHSWATLALRSGVHPKVVAERLGHSNVGITLDRYSHVIGGMDRAAAEQVAELLFGP